MRRLLAIALVSVTLLSSTACSGFIRSYGYLTGQEDETSQATDNGASSGSDTGLPLSGGTSGESELDIEKTDSQNKDGDNVTSAGQAYNTYSEVYYAVADTVVEITTEIVQTSIWMGEYVSQGAGSGVIVNPDGYIVTNYHVIEGASYVTVRLNDGSEYDAALVGAYAEGDLAVIKINPEGRELSAAKLGCSADLVVGEDVVAIGNPLGSLGGTLTTGIISATDRVLTIGGEQMTLLQTNAAINPGNSGGGLFNMAGELIGIVNAKAAGEDIEGLGFAIPVDAAYSSIVDMINYGYVRGMVDHGLVMLDVTEQNLYQYRFYGINTTGIYVIESRLTDEIKQIDKIISVDGVSVFASSEAEAILKSKNVGDKVKIVLERGGKSITVTLTLAEKTPDFVSFD